MKYSYNLDTGEKTKDWAHALFERIANSGVVELGGACYGAAAANVLTQEAMRCFVNHFNLEQNKSNETLMSNLLVASLVGGSVIGAASAHWARKNLNIFKA